MRILKESRRCLRQRDHLRDLLDRHLQRRLGFSFLGVHGFPTLCLELGKLLWGKNSLRLSQERSPAFLCAACLHAFCLPRFDFRLLIGREI